MATQSNTGPANGRPSHTRGYWQLATLIYISAMANLHYHHDHFIVADFVNNPIIALPQPIPFLA